MADPLTILIVDDRPDTVLSLTEFLIARRHSVTLVGNVREAVAHLAKRREGTGVDLVITELDLPGQDGLFLLRELKRRQDPAETVILTSHARDRTQLAQDADRLGVLAVLDKPVDLSRIDQVLLQVGWERTPGPPASAPGAKKDDQPFFGTSRTIRAEDVRTAQVRRESDTYGKSTHSERVPVGRDTPLPFDEADAQAIEPPRPRRPTTGRSAERTHGPGRGQSADRRHHQAPSRRAAADGAAGGHSGRA